MRVTRGLILWIAFTGTCLAQQPPTQPPPTPGPPSEVLPFRLELGGYTNQVDRGYGNWRGLEAQLWIRAHARFIPAFLVDTQTRPTGTQQNYVFLSYANWSQSFYTVQGVSWAPQRSDEAVYFPKRRYDIKGFFKLPPKRNLVLGAGFTRFDMGAQGHGQIFNLGATYYRDKLIVEGNAFINRNQPGSHVSSSGRLSIQYGTEGRYWVGASVGGGRELYQYVGQVPFDVQFSSYSASVFYRRWFTRHVGVHVSADYLDKLHAYRRVGISSRIFFEF